jgi:hypothetical protein
MRKSAAPLAGRPDAGLWIYGPWLDLLVGCGAWSAPLLLFYYFADSRALAWSAVFYGLALFFNYPHYMATIYRAYRTAEDRQKYRIFTEHITTLILLTLLVSHFWYRALPWIFTLYLTWSPWHYSGQNYGLFMMFARRALLQHGSVLLESPRAAGYLRGDTAPTLGGVGLRELLGREVSREELVDALAAGFRRSLETSV